MTIIHEVIRLKNVQFSYPDRPAVFDDLNFTYSSGQKIGLAGANGSGKTTLFHIIMGLLKPQSGEVEIFGKQCYEEDDFIEVRKKIGILFQNPENQLLCPTVAEDIAFGPLNLGKPKQEVEKIVHETCDLLGLTGYENRVPFKLSVGEQRLVALAGIIAMKPNLLLLDEPFEGLDQKNWDILYNYLKNKENSFILISQHASIIKNLCEDGVHRMHARRSPGLSSHANRGSGV